MATIQVKYKYGQEVNCRGIPGIITGIFIRGKNKSYEFSYNDSDGNPEHRVVEQCEIEADNSNNKIGFNKKQE